MVAGAGPERGREGPVGTVPGGGRGAAGRASGRPQLGSWSASLAEGCALLPRLEPLPNPKPSFRPRRRAPAPPSPPTRLGKRLGVVSGLQKVVREVA